MPVANLPRDVRRPVRKHKQKHILISDVVEDDKAAMLRFCRAAHAESIFKEIPFSESKFEKIFQNVLQNPERNLGIKAQLEDQVLGVLYCSLGGYFIGDGAIVASVNMINIEKRTRSTVLGGRIAVKLVRHLEGWSRSKSADLILFYVTSGEALPRTDRFFRKFGMTTIGGNYGIRLS